MNLQSAVVGSVVLISLIAGSVAGGLGGFFEPRPKMGHLATTKSLTELYRVYFRLFIEPTMTAKQLGQQSPLHDDDWRVYSPQNDQCVNFLKAFIVLGYKLINIEDFILMDACLGYLYDEHTYRWLDNQEEQAKLTINALARDNNLKKIYDGTLIDSTTDTDSLACLKSLLMNVMSLRIDDSNTNCNKQWLEQYNNYANCRGVLKPSPKKSDTYIDLVSEIVKEMAVSCFYNEIEILKNEMEKWYQSEVGARLAKGVKATLGFASEADKQTAKRHWPKKLMRVLQVVLDKPVTSAIDLQYVRNMADGLRRHDVQMEQEFRRNLANYANKKITIKSDSFDDPDGTKRYSELMAKLCKPFRSPPLATVSSEKNNEIQQQRAYDFNGIIYQLVTMLFFDDYFGLDDRIFISEIQVKNDTTWALYAADYMCRYIGLTVGRVNNKKEQSSQLKTSYDVEIAHNADVVMQLWPITSI